MKSTLDKLNNFIKQMSHFDPDNMEMGAKAVCELVLSGQLKLEQDKDTANRIREAFIKQMQLDNYNVHAHAIRCIADMVPKLPGDQVEHIFSKIIQSIADKDLDQKKREIYGICAGTVIHQAAEEYGQKLSELFVESVNQLMISKDQKNQIEVILINVISEFIRKWPRISANSRGKFDCNQLVMYLLRNVQTKSKLEIVKKSQTALGKVAMILTKNLLETLFENKDYGILVFLSGNLGKMDGDSMKKMRNGLLCLANVLKTHNGQIKYWSKKIAQILIHTINGYKQNDNIDQIDLTCDILDSSIICLSYLLKSYSRELEDLLQDSNQPLSQFVEELINFDLEGQMGYVTLENQAMNDDYQGGDDDYGCYEAQGENDEKGWKVRRAMMHYIIVLLKKDRNFKNRISSSPELINLLSAKLVQSNSMVSQMAFQTFNNLIQCISTEKNVRSQEDVQDLSLMRVKSNEKNLAKTIIDQINNRIEIILESTKFSDQLKIEGNRIIYRLIQIFRQDLKENTELVDSLMKTLSKQLTKTQIQQNQNYCLLALKQLISNFRPFKDYELVLKETIKLLKSSNLKLISSAYKCVRTFISVFPKQIINSAFFGDILTIIKTKLKQHDADRVVKYSVIKCLGPIFENYIEFLKPQDQRQIISALNTKIHIEIQKSYILEQINRIPNNYRCSIENISLYNEMLQHVTSNLGSSNAELNFQVMETTAKVMRILDNNLDLKAAENILIKTKPIFSEYKVPEFLSILIEKFPKSIKPYAESIVKSTQSAFIKQLIEKKIVNQSDCIKILKAIDREDSAKNISEILAQIGVIESDLKTQVDESKWGVICLGALGYVGNLASVKYLTDSILNHKNEEFRLVSASALGNVASRNQSLVKQITILAEKTGDYYIFIYAFKEYINFQLKNSSPNNQLLADIINWLFVKSENIFEGESIYHLISQCIGKIAFLSAHNVNLIIKFAESNVQKHRFVVAHSLRFYFDGRKNIIEDQALGEYLSKIIQLCGDKDVDVRCSAMKSLNSIAEFHFNLIKPLINTESWNSFKNNLHFNESLIIEVDYGISKEKKDLGRPLRIESFNLLKFLTKNCTLDSQLVDQLMLISLNTINKESNPDLVIKRLSTVRKLCHIDFTQFISHIGLFIQKIGIEEGVLKLYQNKAVIQDQRSDIYLKSILKEIILINKQAQKQNIDQIRGYLTTLKAVPRFAPIFDSEDLITAEHD